MGRITTAIAIACGVTACREHRSPPPSVVPDAAQVVVAADAAPRMHLDDVEVSLVGADVGASLDRDAFESAIRDTYTREVDACVRSRGLVPEVAGRLTIAFDASDVQMPDDLEVEAADVDLRNCVYERAASWHVPAPEVHAGQRRDSRVTIAFEVVPVVDGPMRGVRGDGDRPPSMAPPSRIPDGPTSLAPPPRGRITIADTTAVDRTSLGAADVTRKIKSVYLTTLRRCYAIALETAPALGGDATLAFTVIESGRAAAVSVHAPEPTLSQCLADQTRNWMFPKPADADAESATARFRIELKLAPE
jgi:hypothetical protein